MRDGLHPKRMHNGSREAFAAAEECLRLAARGRVSAWDAEFVLVADALGLRLVTADKRLKQAFPGLVVALDDMTAER
jgi:hypothetical protein